MKQLFLLTALIITSIAGAQKIPVLKHDSYVPYEYSVAESKAWEKAIDNYHKNNYDRLDEAAKGMIDSLETSRSPLTQGPDCSWYCGGGPDKITASSFMPSADSLYVPANIHDFDVLTPWIPKAGKEIGAKLDFRFPTYSPDSYVPRVTTIIIYNGYLKNMDLWKKNARAKKIKLYIDGTPKAIFELADLPGAQSFSIEPVRSGKGKSQVFTLEVLETYPGSKYTDLAIAEINFDGLDVHCFGAGTIISMADGVDKPIESVRPGDEVLCTNSPRLILTSAKVARVVSTEHRLKKLTFEGITILATDDHPFLTEQKEWASLNPKKSNSNYQQDYPVEQLEIGDKVWWATEREWITLTAISDTDAPQASYTLELENGTNFIANGLLVKTEFIKPEQ